MMPPILHPSKPCTFRGVNGRAEIHLKSVSLQDRYSRQAHISFHRLAHNHDSQPTSRLIWHWNTKSTRHLARYYPERHKIGNTSPLTTIQSRSLPQNKRLDGKFASDTLFGPIKSLIGNTASQLYSHKCGFAVPYHLNKVNGEKVGSTLKDFIHVFGVPHHLTFDRASY